MRRKGMQINTLKGAGKSAAQYQPAGFAVSKIRW
jgi:hypothetical protein